MFEDRVDAGTQLAHKLIKYEGKNPLVLAIPRGGVIAAKIVADELGGDLDVVLVHKLGHPTNPEYAIGALDEAGNIYVADKNFQSNEWKEFIERERANQLLEIKHRRKKYTPIGHRIKPEGRVVIIVDDGSATGWTMKAAIACIRREKPKCIVAALGVAPITAIAEIDAVADETVCVEVPKNFESVGQFYNDFSQVSDDEVMDILGQA